MEKVRISKCYKRGAFLYQIGEEPTGIYFVASGLVGLTLVGISGREHLLRLCKRGQFLSHRSLLASEPYHASAVSLENSEIYFVPKKEFFEIYERYPSGCKPIVQSLARELRQAEIRFASMSDKDVTARIAETLIYLKNVYPDHAWTRREIAELCGSTTSTVIKVLARFESTKIISQDGRAIVISDAEALLTVSNQASFA